MSEWVFESGHTEAMDLSTPKGIQQALACLGFEPGPADGIIGPVTRRAVRTFQSYAGLDIDGIVGPITRQALFDALTTSLYGGRAYDI